jgi:hypothetical protein
MKVGSYDGSGFFGELALMYNMPRAATIKARTGGVLWSLVRFSLKGRPLHQFNFLGPKNFPSNYCQC